MYSWVAFVLPTGSHPQKRFFLMELKEDLMLFCSGLWRVSFPSADLIQTAPRLCVLLFPRESFCFVLMLMQLFLLNLIIRSRRASRTWLVFCWPPNLSLSIPSFLFLHPLPSSLLPFYLLIFALSQSTHPSAKKNEIKRGANATSWWADTDPMKCQASIIDSYGHLANVPVKFWRRLSCRSAEVWANEVRAQVSAASLHLSSALPPSRPSTRVSLCSASASVVI